MFPRPLDNNSRLPWEDSVVVERADARYPGISVVIPIFNCGSFLERTLRSLLFNDLQSVQIIVMDGGSTDNTAEILEHYGELFDVCVSEPDEGQSDAINKGFAYADSPILHWLNGDDLLLPNVLSRVQAAFGDAKDCDVLVGDAYMTDRELEPIRHVQFTESGLGFGSLINYSVNHLVQPSVFFTRKAWEECGPLRTDLHYAMDADLFLGMSSKFKLHHLPEDIAYSVYHEHCKTRSNRFDSILELSLVQAKHGGLAEALKTTSLITAEAARAKHEDPGSGEGGTSANEICPHCSILQKKLSAVESEVSKNKKLLLEIDKCNT
ncbi:MAG: glycosyltransferase family 2 protein [Candidatus Wenzhouxiangella sp. M2_3B_020]